MHPEDGCSVPTAAPELLFPWPPTQRPRALGPRPHLAALWACGESLPWPCRGPLSHPGSGAEAAPEPPTACLTWLAGACLAPLVRAGRVRPPSPPAPVLAPRPGDGRRRPCPPGSGPLLRSCRSLRRSRMSTPRPTELRLAGPLGPSDTDRGPFQVPHEAEETGRSVPCTSYALVGRQAGTRSARGLRPSPALGVAVGARA